MFLKGRVVIATLGALALSASIAGSATAAHTASDVGNYHQSAYDLGCTNIISGDATLSAIVAGEERRYPSNPFQTYNLKTKVYAQKLIDGQWKRVAHTDVVAGDLGTTYPRPPLVIAPFNWDGYMVDALEAQFTITVHTAGQYRVEVATRDFNIDGVHLAKLDDVTPTSCTVIGS